MKLSMKLMMDRSDGEAIAVNLPDLDPVETPEGVKVRLESFAENVSKQTIKSATFWSAMLTR